MKRRIRSSHGIVVLVFALAFCLLVILNVYLINDSQSTSLSAKPEKKEQYLDGKYIFDTKSPYDDSFVKISSSTPTSLYYSISTVHLGHLGGLDGKAINVSTSSLIFIEKADNGPYEKYYDDRVGKEYYDKNLRYCVVTITFLNMTHLSYTTSLEGCRDYHGAHGMFFDDEVHEKNGKVTLPTIKDLGFTEADRKVFDSLVPRSLQTVEGFIDKSNAKKLTSKDVPNALAYSLESQNMYNAWPCENFADAGGSCGFAVIMKDVSSYWVVSGYNGGAFTYATNDNKWKNKLPDVFKSELTRVGVDINKVVFTP